MRTPIAPTSSRTAVQCLDRVSTFDTFEEASLFADREISAGRSVVSIYCPDLLGPIPMVAPSIGDRLAAAMAPVIALARGGS
jgi:hypothetical protein